MAATAPPRATGRAPVPAARSAASTSRCVDPPPPLRCGCRNRGRPIPATADGWRRRVRCGRGRRRGEEVRGRTGSGIRCGGFPGRQRDPEAVIRQPALVEGAEDGVDAGAIEALELRQVSAGVLPALGVFAHGDFSGVHTPSGSHIRLFQSSINIYTCVGVGSAWETAKVHSRASRNAFFRKTVRKMVVPNISRNSSKAFDICST